MQERFAVDVDRQLISGIKGMDNIIGGPTEENGRYWPGEKISACFTMDSLLKLNRKVSAKVKYIISSAVRLLSSTVTIMSPCP